MTRTRLGIAATFAALVLIDAGVGAARQSASVGREVDATTFLLAFRAESAEQYFGYRVSGAAPNFRSVQPVNVGAGAKYLAVLTVGAARDGGSAELLRDWSAWREADMAGRTLDIMLEIKGQPPVGSAQKFPPDAYTFSGLYLGNVEMIPRVSLGAAETPCGNHHTPGVPGTHAPHAVRSHGTSHTQLVPGYEQRRYCVPVLGDGTLK